MAIWVKRKSEGFQEAHDINVTPFIDVMLVLLIIFMVAAPLATVSVPLDLPVSNAEPEEPPAEPIIFSIQADLTWSIGNETIVQADLEEQLDKASKGDPEARIFVRADRVVTYEDLMKAMNALREAGYLKVALVGLEGSEE